MITVTVCVGSSCHIKGARRMIGRFNEVLAKEGLQDKVELKGSFCMGLSRAQVSRHTDGQTNCPGARR
jgi:NADH:ubiquinone oxidoreductase subunit E